MYNQSFRKQNTRYRYCMSALSIIVAILTICVLMLPAFAAEKEMQTGIDNSADSLSNGADIKDNKSENHDKDKDNKEDPNLPDKENSLNSDDTQPPKIDTNEDMPPAPEETPASPDKAAADTIAPKDDKDKYPLPEIFSSAPIDDLAAIAQSQVGYHAVILENGQTYTKYGDQYQNSDGKWDGMFIAFCLSHAKIDKKDFPFFIDYPNCIDALQQDGLYCEKEKYQPKTGDIAFFDKDSDRIADHAGIIVNFDHESMSLEIIEGDVNEAVEKNTYSAKDPMLLGYGMLNSIHRSQTDTVTAPSNISNSHPASQTSAKLYQGYYEDIEINGSHQTYGLRVKDGFEADNSDRISYCYDRQASLPTSENTELWEGKDDRCYFSRIENYLESHDDYIEKYGELAKQKTAAVLYVGYPNNAFGHKERIGGMTNNDARVVTQRLVWDINDKREGELSVNDPPQDWSSHMVRYYNAIYNDCIKNFVDGKEFDQGWLDVIGDFTFSKSGEYWITGVLNTIGEKGTISFSNVSPDLQIINYENDDIITNKSIPVGTSFYIRSLKPLNKQQSFTINYTYKQAIFYFYKYEKGGERLKYQTGKQIQNMIRVEPTDNVLENSIEWTLDGEKTETCSVQVTKQWDGEPHTSAKILLLANGTKIDEAILDLNNGWKHTFTGLPKSENGKKIKYTVDEEEIDGYKKEITEISDSEFIITNHQINYILPETGGIGTTVFYMSGSMLIISAAILLLIKKKSENRDHKI